MFPTLLLRSSTYSWPSYSLRVLLEMAGVEVVVGGLCAFEGSAVAPIQKVKLSGIFCVRDKVPFDGWAGRGGHCRLPDQSHDLRPSCRFFYERCDPRSQRTKIVTLKTP